MSHGKKKGSKKKSETVISDPQSKGADGQPTQKLNQRGIKVTRNSNSDVHNRRRQHEKNNPWYSRWYERLWQSLNAANLVAFGTIFLGLVGVATIVVMVSSRNETAKQFSESQRARMVVGDLNGVAATLDDSGDKTNIAVHLRNTGRNTAHDVILKVSPLLAPPGSRFQYAQLNPAKDKFEIGPSVGQREPFTAYLPLDRPDATLVRDGTKFLRAVGRINYWDDLGTYCEPIGLMFDKDHGIFFSNVIPPPESVCSPKTGEGETFTIDSTGLFTVTFFANEDRRLSPNEPPTEK